MHHEEDGNAHDTFTFNTNTTVPDSIGRSDHSNAIQNFHMFFSIDWRKSGCVTGVKDEGPTDLSAVYTVTGVLEGQSCIPTGKLVALSNQNIIDCVCRRGLSCSLE